jgi:hypothetical protein
MSDIPVTWKKISRGLPKIRRYADDRAPTIEEIQKICEYPDRRIKGIVCTMSSCRIRLGAWDYLCWGHIEPIRREGKIIAAKIVVYAGDDEEYFSFVTREAYSHLEKWMEYPKECGENIDDNSWVVRQLWNTKQGHYHHGTIKDAAKLKSSGVKRLIEDALWTQGIRRKSNLKRNRYEFQTDHGFRKWFKTRCEIAGMKSINIEKLMGHSIGISDSYYRVTDNELGKDYLKAIDYLTISNEHKLQMQVSELMEKTKNSDGTFQSALQEKQEEIQILRQRDSMNTDAIANLSDQMMKMAREIEELKKA